MPKFPIITPMPNNNTRRIQWYKDEGATYIATLFVTLSYKQL